MQKIDLTGKTFEYLTVSCMGNGKVVGKKNKARRTTWICNCVCGKVVDVSTVVLTTGLKTSCGCKTKPKYNFIDLTGKTFGALTVLSRLEERTKDRGVLWECKCSCGKMVKIPSNSLTSGNTKTCLSKVCRNSVCDNYLKKIGDISLSHLNSIKQNATKRNYSYNVLPEYLWDLYLKQNKKCALSGISIGFAETIRIPKSKNRSRDMTASLDRIDNRRGYEEGNVRWVHKKVNIMRNNSTDLEFHKWCELCYFESIKNIKPNWDTYFMRLVKMVATRSCDPNTKHGCILVQSIVDC